MGFVHAGLLTIVLTGIVIASTSHGMVTAIPDMSLKARLSLLAILLLAAGAAWFHVDGGFDYLIWAYRVPARPAAERHFVSLVEREMRVWSADTDAAERQIGCRSPTTEIEELADAASDWSGTVLTAYRIGTMAVLVVKSAAIPGCGPATTTNRMRL